MCMEKFLRKEKFFQLWIFFASFIHKRFAWCFLTVQRVLFQMRYSTLSYLLGDTKKIWLKMKKSQILRKPLKDFMGQNHTDAFFSCYSRWDFWIPHYEKVQGTNFQSNRVCKILFTDLRSQKICSRVKFGRGHALKWGDFWQAVNLQLLEILISNFFWVQFSAWLTHNLKTIHILHGGLQTTLNLTWNDP